MPIPNDIYAFGKFSLGDIFPMQTFFFFGTGGTIPTAVEISTMEDRPRGGVGIHRRMRHSSSLIMYAADGIGRAILLKRRFRRK